MSNIEENKNQNDVTNDVDSVEACEAAGGSLGNDISIKDLREALNIEDTPDEEIKATDANSADYTEIESGRDDAAIELPAQDELASIANEAQEAAKIEPASGAGVEVGAETETEEGLSAVAQKLAQVEPAAGENAGGGNAGSSDGGYGFQSGFDAQGVIPINDVGPIDPTELKYGVNNLNDELFILEEKSLLPLNPVLEIDVQYVYEDRSIFIAAFAAPETSNGDLVIVISNIPTGWTVTDNAFDNVGNIVGTGVFDAVAGTWTITTTGGIEFGGGPKFTPPADSDVDALNLVFTVNESNPDGRTGSANAGFDIIVDAVTDAPEIDALDDAGDEGETLDIDLSALTGEEVNNGAGADDGSESITYYEISGVPAGFTLSAGVETFAGSGVYILTPAEIVGLQITPNDPQFFGSIDLTATVYTTENPVTDGEFDFKNNNNQASDIFTLTWNPLIDPPSITINNGIDDVIVKEDGTIDVPITAALAAGHSAVEFLTVTVTGIDAAWGNFSAPIGTYDSVSGTWAVTLPAGASLNTLLTFSPNSDSDIDLTGLVATAVATDPLAAISASANDGFNVIVDAVADAPNLDALSASGEEGTTIPLTITTSVNDIDGSEIIEVIKISDVPTGATLTAGTYDSVNDVWLLNSADLTGLGINVPYGMVGGFALDIESVAYEQNTNGAEVDLSDNRASAYDRIKVFVKDDSVPVVKDDEVSIDETDLSPTTSVSGTIVADFGSDAPGNITGNATSFIGNIASGGTPIVVGFNAATNTYTGTAGAEVIFTLVVQSNGDYVFELNGVIDHPDATDLNDSLPLEFGVTAIDSDGSEADAIITINVLDDAPIAQDDYVAFDGALGNIGGNVVDNDDLSKDQDNTVTQIKFGSNIVDVPANGSDVTINGDNGVLTINNTGEYSYDLLGGVFAGDSASLDPVSSDVDGVQSSLTKDGITISVANTGNFDISWMDTPYGSGLGIDNLDTGDSKKVWPKGETFDIAFDQDVKSTTITIAEIGDNNDDGNHGVDYVVTLADGSTVVGEQQFVPSEIVNGQISFTLDSSDFGGQLITSIELNSTNSGNYGGASFLLNNVTAIYSQNECVEDVFEYILTDGDGDNDDALLKIKAYAPDEQPIITQPEVVVVDETDLAPTTSISDKVVVDFGNDGPGVIQGNGNYNLGGITSGGALVTVVFNAVTSTYIGTAGADDIFTLQIQPNGDYTFTLQGVIDHPDAIDPNDSLPLEFGVTAIDSDGDSVDASIIVNVLDDAPIAQDDYASGSISDGNIGGNVVDNDDLSKDQDNTVTQIKFGSNVVDVPANGSDVTINGDNGVLTINSSGDYNYVPYASAFSSTYTFSKDNPPGSDAGGDIKNVKTSFNGDTNEFSFSLTVEDVSNGFFVAINGGANPKGHEAEMALIYFDASDVDPVVSVYAYNGMNAQTSWFDGSKAGGIQPADAILNSTANAALFSNISVVTDGLGNKVFSFKMDATDIINHDPVYGPDGEWSGVAFADAIGMWLHPVQGLGTSYRPDGFLEQWSTEGQGWYDTSYQTTMVMQNECVNDVFEYVLTDSDGDSDSALLEIKAYAPNEDLIIGQNVDDVEGSVTPHLINGDEAVIQGAAGNDILVGDAGGSFLEPQTQDYNFVFMLDVSGSMGSASNPNSRMSILKGAVENLLNEFSTYKDGQVKVHITPFAKYLQPTGTFIVTDADELLAALSYIETFTGSGYTNYEVAFQDAISWLQSGDAIGGDAITTTYFISDGVPNKYIDANGNVAYNTADVAMDEILGLDGSNEVAILKGLNDDVIAVGIDANVSVMANLNVIDMDGTALNIDDPSDLSTVLASTNPIDGLDSVGGDVIEGGSGDDIIFGDVLFTDDVATLHGLSIDEGAGWEVFERLENGESTIDTSWDRSDTIAYIRANSKSLAEESVNSKGDGRSGGDDILLGDAGDDLIFGQEGNDIISGDVGNDVLYGGSGADMFLFKAINEGLDIVKDFDVAEGDIIDISSLLTGYDKLNDDIADFIIATEISGDTIISIDQSGNSGVTSLVDMVVLEGVTGLDMDLSIKTDTL